MFVFLVFRWLTCRILKPDGTIAVMGYDLCTLEAAALDDGAPDRTVEERFNEASALVRTLYSGTLGSYWSDRRALLDVRYRGVEPPEELFSDVVRYLQDRRREFARCLTPLRATRCGCLQARGFDAQGDASARVPGLPELVERLRYLPRALSRGCGPAGGAAAAPAGGAAAVGARRDHCVVARVPAHGTREEVSRRQE